MVERIWVTLSLRIKRLSKLKKRAENIPDWQVWSPVKEIDDTHSEYLIDALLSFVEKKLFLNGHRKDYDDLKFSRELVPVNVKYFKAIKNVGKIRLKPQEKVHVSRYENMSPTGNIRHMVNLPFMARMSLTFNSRTQQKKKFCTFHTYQLNTIYNGHHE